MNIANTIQRREQGLESICDYDFVLHRLKCYHNNIYRGITTDLTIPDCNAEPPVLACSFCTTPGYEEVLALANEDGRIALHDTKVERKLNGSLEGKQAHCNAIFDIAWMPRELKLVTVSGDHTARLWDVSRPEVDLLNCFHAHTRSIKTVVFRHEDKAVFATGARDGSIMLWDIRANHFDLPRPDNCISNAHCIGSGRYTRRKAQFAQILRPQSITGLVFQDDFTLISCAAADGLIKIWDLRKNYTVHKKEPLPKIVMNGAGNYISSGFSSLLMCPSRITLYASCLDDIIYAYNISSYNCKPVAKYYGHQNRTYYVKTCLSSDGRYLASGSSDTHAYIWRIDRSGVPLVKLYSHVEEVTCIAWCSVGETKIVTCSDDSSHRIWKVGLEHKEENEEIRVRGRAKVVLEKHLEYMKLETTPTTSRRSITPQNIISSDNTLAITPESGNEDGINYRDKRNPAKRTYLQMTMESNSERKHILSPIYENDETTAKRAHMDNRSTRKLFSSSTETTIVSNRNYDSDEPNTSQSTSTGINDGIIFSPTLNLPNFVMDGTAPHLLEISPQKYKENVDWLTKMRKERYEQRKRTTSCSPKNQVISNRRSNRSRSTEPPKASKITKTTSSLLHFFKAASKDCDSNQNTENNNLEDER